MLLSVLELRILAGLARGDTLAQIAGDLYLKHPSISRAVHAAERRVGVALVEQSGRRLRLTTAGHDLATAADDVLGRYADLERLAAQLREGAAGTVRVLGTRSACSYIFRALERFATAYPQAVVSLAVALRPRCGSGSPTAGSSMSESHGVV